MHSRIPLSIVFSAEGRRHVIPHRTFRVAAQAADGSADASTYTGAAEEGIAFFQYLDSNDTRMPPHPHLRAYAHPAEEYETYVGEEVWNATDEAPTSASGHPPVHDTGKARSGSASCCATSEDSAPVPSFRSVVEWVNSVFEEEWASDGVVLCGRYVVADDGAWVVPSRSPALYTTREVFLLMRNSSKFLHDVHAQVIDVRASARRGAHSGSLTFEFTLAKSLAGSGASEMRAILPYPLHFSPQKRAWAVDDTAASLSFTGIGQRVTDVCFPSLMAWTEAEHDDNFRFMQRRIEQAALLERTCVADPGFISRLVRAFDKRMHQESAADEVSGRQHSHPSLALLLALDLLFESPSLPIYVLSAKARVFEVAPRTSAPWTAINDASQWHLWTPLLADADATGAEGASHGATAADAACRGDGNTQATPLGEDEESEGTEEDEEEDVTTGSLDFFRMFRDVGHWNQYVRAMAARLQQSCAGAMGPDDSNKPSRGVQHYCVIASESADLVACADTRTKRGLPLELMHPELLEMNEEAAGFLKMLREGLLKRPGGDN
ncbi:hypothetical protein, conserved [Leishmania donovani]|uniref:Uncharacterized protein n=1 Tax=Leishmania donovani TaxID=5661 RepID=E9BJT6_LEIDO|nr:hypothetical protein, conserved [Leishmania donovani]CBZ35620.1 hypothetical protein, conserved [Leishmania donovani]